jgi:2-oxo-4-hydroxy-4-carboxy-5-ureidoimidazoline decarboxylase
MTNLLEARLPNERQVELENAAEEQRKIFHIRLNQLLDVRQ